MIVIHWVPNIQNILKTQIHSWIHDPLRLLPVAERRDLRQEVVSKTIPEKEFIHTME